MWVEKNSPLRLERRFEFENYQKISAFLNTVDNLCKESNIYPNISFGKSFVSITIFTNYEKISPQEKDFSLQIEKAFKIL